MARSKESKNNKPRHKWTDEEKEYLKSIVKNNSYKEIAKKMNDRFNCDFSEEQIKGFMARNKLVTGRGGHFKKGSIPWNKGTKGLTKANKTSFKKGIIHFNYKQVGEERIDKYGYVQIKVAEPNVWDLKHRAIYREHYGEIPDGHNIIFADGNKMNFDIDNLIAVSKSEMLILNNNNLRFEDKELTKVGVNIAKVIDKAKKVSK